VSGALAETVRRELAGLALWMPQWNIVALIKIPGVSNVRGDLSLREKLRRARDRKVWPDRAIVRIDFG